MAVKILNIVTARKYEKDGQEKTQWNNVGRLIHFPPTKDKKEGFMIELNMFPNTKFMVFEQQEKDERSKGKSLAKTTETESTEEIGADDIPF